MKILITGYKGFIGQNMVNALTDHHTITTYEWGEPLPQIRGLDWVIHLGAISSTTETNVENVILKNYDFSRRLLHECISNRVNFQYASSASVYGLNQNFKETDPVNPLSPYAWSKYLFDKYVGEQAWINIQVQGFRYFNVYGPHEDHKGNQASPYHKFEHQAKTTGVIKLFENSHRYHRDFVPVETVIDIHKTFFNVKESGLWNVGTGIPKSFQQVAEEVSSQHTSRLEYIPMPENIKHQYQYYTCADLTKLHKHYEKDNSQRIV